MYRKTYCKKSSSYNSCTQPNLKFTILVLNFLFQNLYRYKDLYAHYPLYFYHSKLKYYFVRLYQVFGHSRPIGGADLFFSDRKNVQQRQYWFLTPFHYFSQQRIESGSAANEIHKSDATCVPGDGSCPAPGWSSTGWWRSHTPPQPSGGWS